MPAGRCVNIPTAVEERLGQPCQTPTQRGLKIPPQTHLRAVPTRVATLLIVSGKLRAEPLTRLLGRGEFDLLNQLHHLIVHDGSRNRGHRFDNVQVMQIVVTV